MDNLDLMRSRLEWQGGIHQEDRMIKDKWRGLQKALLYSYQACTVQMVQKYTQVLDASLDPIDPDMGTYPIARALINPDKNKANYDDKIFSIDHLDEFEPGDVFEWKKTDTYWIIYLREITEDAYFRGEIRRCRYKIKFLDDDGNWCYTYAAVQGPVETQIDSIQKNQIRIDEPNLSLTIYMPRNEKTLRAFDRYKEFMLESRCWKVTAPDTVSMEGVIEVNAVEDFVNRDTDDTLNEMKNGLVIEPLDPTPDSGITGETFIKPKIAERYSVEEEGGEWSVLECYPFVSLNIIDETTVEVVWIKATHGQFTLVWTNGDTTYEKVVVVESLF